MSEQHRSDSGSDSRPAAAAAPSGRYLRRSFLLGAAAAGAGAAAGLAGREQAEAAPVISQAADHKSGFVAHGGDQVSNGFGTSEPPNVNLATGVNVWGNEAGVVGNGPIGVRATGTPIAGESALGLRAEAKTTGTGTRARAVGVESDAVGVSPMTIGVDSSATSDSTNPHSMAIGLIGAASAKKGVATGVVGTASSGSFAEPATGVAGSVVALGSPGIGVSGDASTEVTHAPVTGVAGTANSMAQSAPAIGVCATATTGEETSPATGVEATAVGPVGWGISATGPKGGRFASADSSAQLNLVPQVTASLGKAGPVTPAQFENPGAVLPRAGEAGDFWFTITGQPTDPETATLWICVRPPVGTAPAQWSQVLLGQPFPGQA
jgi:hypothetical protein